MRVAAAWPLFARAHRDHALIATIGAPHIGFHGHLIPLARLSAVLVRQGHRVIAWAPEKFRDALEATGSDFRRHEHFDLRSEASTPQRLTAALAEHTVRHLESVIDEFLDAGVELLVHDYQTLWARVAGEFLGLPRIVSHPLYPGRALRLAPFHPLESDLVPQPLLATIGPALVRLARARAEILRRWGVDIGSEWIDAMVSTGDSTVHYSTPLVTGIDAPASGMYVGPLLDPRQYRSLTSDAPFVYASLGTVFNFDLGRYRTILDAALGQRFEMVLTLGGDAVAEDALGPVPGNVTVRRFVSDVPGTLRRASAFLTHGGASSVHEALLAGVPIVCWPFGADQLDWGRRVEELGVGVLADGRADSIRAALEAVLSDGRFRRRAAEVGAELRAFPGAERVAELVDRVLGPLGPERGCR